MPKRFRNKTYVNKVDRILVELWVNDQKLLSVNVEENFIASKAADFKATAFREGHRCWAVYVVRPCMKPGANMADRRLSKEMQAKWKATLNKKYKH